MGIRGDTLVLNKQWFPIHIIEVGRAFTRLCSGTVNALDHRTGMVHDFSAWRTLPVNEKQMELFEDFVRHGPGTPILVPRVVILTKYDRLPRHELKYSRGGVFERDNYRCQYCGNDFKRNRRDSNGRPRINIDHVIPRNHPTMRFPGTNFDNCVTACIKCNQRKGNRTPKEAGMKLLSKPYIPEWKPMTAGVSKVHSSWRNFLPGEEECLDSVTS